MSIYVAELCKQSDVLPGKQKRLEMPSQLSWPNSWIMQIV